MKISKSPRKSKIDRKKLLRSKSRQADLEVSMINKSSLLSPHKVPRNFVSRIEARSRTRDSLNFPPITRMSRPLDEPPLDSDRIVNIDLQQMLEKDTPRSKKKASSGRKSSRKPVT